MLRLISIFFFAALIWIDTVAQNSNHPKLFQDEEPLSIRLEYSFKEIIKSNSDSIYFPSVLYYSSDKQHWDSVKIGVRGSWKIQKGELFFYSHTNQN